MDLFRTLRVSIYVLVASSAFSIALVERDLKYLMLVIASGIVAMFTVDVGRFRPARSSVSGLFGIALLLYFMNPALAAYLNGQPADTARHMAHFLCAIQITLFFSSFRGSTLFAFCGSSLFIVVLSGILEPGPSLILRLMLFLGAMTWTLFVHALWRERSRFEAGAGVRRDPARGSSRVMPVGVRSVLPERAARQGLMLSGALSMMCLVLGFLLFFSWPRLNDRMGQYVRDLFGDLQQRQQEEASGQDGELGLKGTQPRQAGLGHVFSRAQVGFSPSLSLQQLAPLHNDHTPAVRVRLKGAPINRIAPGLRLYLRGMAFHTYENNDWLQPEALAIQREQPGSAYVDFAPDAPNFLAPQGHEITFTQQIEHITQVSKVYFAMGPVRQLRPAKLLSGGVIPDQEGMLHTPGNRNILPKRKNYHYEVISHPAVHAAALPDGAETAVPDGSRRYLRWTSHDPGRLRALAFTLTRNAGSDLAKSRAILRHLRDSGRYGYTRFLDTLGHQGDHVSEFLLSDESSKRRGHCGYFATAYVILARAAGLPARAASGFTHDLTPSEAASGEAVCLSSDAHAWAEVYFRDYGWVIFDATPGSGGTQENRPQDPQTAESPDDGGSEADHFAPRDRGMINSWWYERFLQYDAQEQEKMYGGMGEKMRHFFDWLGRTLFGHGGSMALKGVLWFLFAAAAGWIAVTLFRSQDRRRDSKRPMPPRARAALNFYNDLLQVLSKKGFTRRTSQTPREFADSVVRRGGETYEPVMVVTRIFERVRYGGEDIDENELARLKSAFSSLNELINKEGKTASG